MTDASKFDWQKTEVRGHNGQADFYLLKDQSQAMQLNFLYIDDDQAGTSNFKVNGFLSLAPAIGDQSFLDNLFKTYPKMKRMYSLFLPNEKEKNPDEASLVFGAYDDKRYALKADQPGDAEIKFFQAGEV